MENVVGIFKEKRNADSAMEELRAAGFAPQRLVLLTPDHSSDTLQRTPSEDGEQPGMGMAIGGVAGGAAGLAAGALVSNFLLPGVGPMVAVGLGSGVFGLGGAVAGGAVGNFLENSLTHGLPKDEIFLYEDALRQGRTVVIAFAENEERIERGRGIMERAGTESLDAARDSWWIGLRDAEAAEYDPHGKSFGDAERSYRSGFEAALRPDCRGKPLDETRAVLRDRYADLCDQEPFRRGYERGQLYYAESNRHGVREDAR
ncbi:MAG: hypothetical protein ACTHLX_09565 [Candidatus Binatia bacterium]